MLLYSILSSLIVRLLSQTTISCANENARKFYAAAIEHFLIDRYLVFWMAGGITGPDKGSTAPTRKGLFSSTAILNGKQ